MTENINTLFSFSVKNSEVSGGRAIRPNTGRAPNALVVMATMTPIVSNRIEFRNIIGYLNNFAVSGSKETKMKSLKNHQ